jgi:hypothetical protein
MFEHGVFSCMRSNWHSDMNVIMTLELRRGMEFYESLLGGVGGYSSIKLENSRVRNLPVCANSLG